MEADAMRIPGALAIGLLAGLVPGPAPAAPPDPAIGRLLAEARRLCREAGGRGIAVSPEAVSRIDLNRDGRPDAVVDFRAIACRERQGVYCGTAGCLHAILLARPDGRLALVFEDRIWRAEVAPEASGPVVRFSVHGSYCGLAGTDDCVIERPLSGRPIALPQPFAR